MDTHQVEALISKSIEELKRIESLPELEQQRVALLGAKGVIKGLLRDIKKVPADERPGFAQKLNRGALAIEETIESVKRGLEEKKLERELAASWSDLSLPGTFREQGLLHPVRQVERICETAMRQLGFTMVEGPEIEDAYYNFDALNIPKHHPARDLQDTFWLSPEKLLRTHTTSVTARLLEEKKPLPVKVAVAGRVYRNEAIDATHLAMFHQFDGFWIDRGLNFSHLKGVTSFLAGALFGKERRLRFKPKYYPYTEPSVGIDVACGSCDGVGCSACHNAGWVTIMGAGMIHPNVFREFGYDPEEVSGIAFGWGTTRMATQLFGLSKLRPLYDGNVRLLRLINGRSPE